MSQANSAIATAGYKAPDVLKQVLDANPGLVPAKQERILHDNALAAQKRAQDGKEQQVRDMVISDPSHALADERIDGMKKEGIISDRGAADLRTLRDNFAKKDKTEQARKETQELSIAMMDVDSQAVALTGPGGQAKASEFKAMGNAWTDARRKKQLDDYVDRKLSTAQHEGKSAEHPALADALQQLRQESTEAILSREVLDRREGKYILTDEKAKAAGIDVSDRVAFSEKNKIVAAHQAQQLRQWFSDYQTNNKGKVPSPEEISQERMRILRPSVQDQVKSALRGQ